MQPAGPPPSLRDIFSSCWVDPSNIDPSALDELIDGVKECLNCPATQVAFEAPVITVACGHGFDKTSIVRWHATNKITCMTCRAEAPEYYDDLVITTLAEDCLEKLNKLKSELEENRKNKRNVDLTELLWFVAVNRNALSLFPCGHSTGSNVVSEALKQQKLQINNPIDLTNKNFKCRTTACGKVVVRAIPHRTLRSISEIVLKGLKQFAAKRPDAPLKSVSCAVIPDVRVKFEDMVLEGFRGCLDRCDFEAIDVLLDNPLSHQPEIRAKISELFLKKYDWHGMTSFSVDHYQCLELILRHNLLTDALRAKFFRQFLALGLRHIFYPSKVNPNTLLTKMFNSDGAQRKIVIQQLSSKLKSPSNENLIEERVRTVVFFLIHEMNNLKDEQFITLVFWLNKYLRSDRRTANLPLESFILRCLEALEKLNPSNTSHKDFVSLVEKYMIYVEGEIAFPSDESESLVEFYMNIIAQLLNSHVEIYRQLGLELFSNMFSVIAKRDAQYFHLIGKRNPIVFSRYLSSFVRTSLSAMVQNNQKAPLNAVLHLMNLSFQNLNNMGSAHAYFIDSALNALRVAKVENFESNIALHSLIKCILKGIHEFSPHVFYENSSFKNSDAYIRLCNGLKDNLLKLARMLGESEITEVLELFINKVVMNQNVFKASEELFLAQNEVLKSLVLGLMKSPHKHLKQLGGRLIQDEGFKSRISAGINIKTSKLQS